MSQNVSFCRQVKCRLLTPLALLFLLIHLLSANLANANDVLKLAGLEADNWWSKVSRRIDHDFTESQYRKLFPHYAEACALSTYKRKNWYRSGCDTQNCIDEGGKGGHATMYLHGACRDEASEYSKIKVCRDSETFNGIDHRGVGISVNQVFLNVNWVAVPGADLFYRGTLSLRERLTKKSFEETVRAIEKAGIFSGIEMMPEKLVDKPSTKTDTAWVITKAIGTDIALNYGRTAFCIRVPLTETELSSMITHLNSLNEKYASSERTYQWDPLKDNCSHAVHNAFAAAGFLSYRQPNAVSTPSKKIDYALQLLTGNLAVPANRIVEIGEITSTSVLRHPLKVWRKREWRRKLEKGLVLPPRPGAIVRTYFMRDQPLNDVFEKGQDPYLVSLPLFYDYKRRRFDIYQNRPLFRLSENFDYFSKVYAEGLEQAFHGDHFSSFDHVATAGQERISLMKYRDYTEFLQDDYVPYLRQQKERLDRLREIFLKWAPGSTPH